MASQTLFKHVTGFLINKLSKIFDRCSYYIFMKAIILSFLKLYFTTSNKSAALPLSLLVLVHLHTPFDLVFPRREQKKRDMFNLSF